MAEKKVPDFHARGIKLIFGLVVYVLDTAKTDRIFHLDVQNILFIFWTISEILPVQVLGGIDYILYVLQLLLCHFHPLVQKHYDKDKESTSMIKNRLVIRSE